MAALLTLPWSMLLTAQPRNIDTVVVEILKNGGVEYVLLEDGRYSIAQEGNSLTISLDNIRRSFEANGDESAVERFIDNLLIVRVDSLPPWAEAQEEVFPYLESADVELGQDTVARTQSDKTMAVLTHYSAVSGRQRFVRDRDLAAWGIGADEAWERAFQNLNDLARQTSVSFLDANGFLLGVVEAREPYKASLILARELRSKVERELGWPVFAVAPARDFVYLISKSAESELGRVGSVVVKEYQQSAYPISAEVWELSDAEMRVVAEFPVQ